MRTIEAVKLTIGQVSGLTPLSLTLVQFFFLKKRRESVSSTESSAAEKDTSSAVS